MTWYEFFETAAKFAPLATAAIALSAAVIAFGAIHAQRDIARRRAAIDFFLKTEMDQIMIDLYARFRRAAPMVANHSSLEEFAKTEHYKDIRSFLNVCELIAVGINQGAFSERVSLAYWGDVLPKALSDTLPLINFVRSTSDEGSAHTYSDLEKICKNWSTATGHVIQARPLQLLAVIFAALSAIFGIWINYLPGLVIGTYWQSFASTACALMSAGMGFLAWRRSR